MLLTRTQRDILRALDMTDAGLTVLCRQAAGRVCTGGTAGTRLIKQGHLDGFGMITDQGRALVVRAREMGW